MDARIRLAQENTGAVSHFHRSGAGGSPPVVSCFFNCHGRTLSCNGAAHSKPGGARGTSPGANQGQRGEGHSRRAARDNLAAQPFDTLRVCWEHLSPQSSLQPQKKWAQAFSDGTRRGRTIFTSKAAKPPELVYKRLTTMATSTSSRTQEKHASTTDHQHESRTNVVCRRTYNTENCLPTRYMYTQSSDILEIKSTHG